ncbi:MAG: hypothetical protein EKK64_11005 [Neisseriaceae bacterium]|jgi:uroporphyrinogen-III synthase|nr:MAG: hypothetical protein EKK64_11005 [Neisseriaceae bacterium]
MPIKVFITRPERDSLSLVSKLIANKIDAEYLPVVEIQSNYFDIEKLSICSNDDLFFSSPTSIEILADWLKSAKINNKIIVPGKYSAERILKINSSLSVVYPKYSSGVAEVISEELIECDKKLVVFGGDKINQRLQGCCHEQQINYEFVSLYQTQNVFAKNVDSLLDYAKHGFCYILVSSSTVAKILCDELSTVSKNLLSNITMISLHQNITTVINDNLNIMVYEILDMAELTIVNEITKLIKK